MDQYPCGSNPTKWKFSAGVHKPEFPTQRHDLINDKLGHPFLASALIVLHRHDVSAILLTDID
jgi:hypothetical protein